MKILSYFIRQKTVWKTTWLGKLAIGLLLLCLLYGSGSLWLGLLTSFVSAKDTAAPADAIVIENWYFPTRPAIRASFQLLSKGFGKSVFLTEYYFSDSSYLTNIEIPPYYHEILDLYFKSEGFGPGEVKKINVPAKDPVTWNTAKTVIETLAAQGYRSLILVSPWYHSRRSCDVYAAIGKKKGVQVFCKPSEGALRRDNWWTSNTGLSTVLTEVIKRAYYLIKGI